MVIRTIEEVNDFSELRHSYLKKLTASTQKRRDKLMQDHYFLCQCPKCQDVVADQMKSSLVCPSCKGCVPTVNASCLNCQHRIPTSLLETHKSLKRQLHSCSITIDDDLFQKARTIFHPFDVSFVEFLQAYSQQQYEAKDYSRCLDISLTKLSHLRQHLPFYHMKLGFEEIQAATFCNSLERLDEAIEHINAAKDILQINFGDDHPILAKEWKVAFSILGRPR